MVSTLSQPTGMFLVTATEVKCLAGCHIANAVALHSMQAVIYFGLADTQGALWNVAHCDSSELKCIAVVHSMCHISTNYAKLQFWNLNVPIG